MSDTELHIGKLIKVSEENETLNQTLLRILNEKKVDYSDSDDTLFNILKDFEDNYNKYFIFKNELYFAEDTEPVDSGDAFCELTKNEDGSISYVTSFYNGGTCFTEMIEDELETFKG